MPSMRPSSRPRTPDQNSPVKSSSSVALSLPARRDFTQSMKTWWTSSSSVLMRSTSSVFSGRKGSRVDLFLPAVWTRRSMPSLLDGLDEAEAGEDDADRADDRGGIGDDLVAAGGDEVAARGRGVLDEDDHGLAVLVGEVADALGDEAGLDRRAAGRIDDDGDGGRGLDGEGALQERGDVGDVEPAGARIGGDDAVEADDGNERRRRGRRRAPSQPMKPAGSSLIARPRSPMM